MTAKRVTRAQTAGVKSGSGAEDDIVALRGDSEGRLLSRADFEPVDAGGQAINIAGSATRSSQLTVADVVQIYAEADCYLVAGGSSVDATSSDYYLPAGIIVEYEVATGKDYISCLQKSTSVTGGLHLCKVA